MEHLEFEWQTVDGLNLYAQGWQPEVEPEAVVCLVHGLGEHSGRYAHLAAVLTEVGYVLIAFDQRGHGKSQGKRGHTPSYELLLEDIAQLLNEAMQRFPGRPYFLYGHSMGGSLVLNYALRRRPRLSGVIATAPWFRLAFEPPIMKVVLGRIMDKLWPSFSQSNELDTQALCRDSEVVRAYEADPLVHNHISARMFISNYLVGQWALEHAIEFSLPLLLMQGSADRIISLKAIRQFVKDVPRDCTFKLWEGFYHEIHNEPQQKDVFAFLIAWLQTHIGENSLTGHTI